MWIQERYSDISRKADPAVCHSGFRIGLFLFAALWTGCVVTDKIEFEDAVNLPFRVVSKDPAEYLILGEKTKPKKFSVTVWDPDVDEVGDIPLSGRVIATSDVWMKPNEYWSCVSKGLEPAEDGRVMYKVICDVTFPQDITAGAFVEYALVVSDLGFYSNGEPRAGANVEEVTWLVEMQ